MSFAITFPLLAATGVATDIPLPLILLGILALVLGIVMAMLIHHAVSREKALYRDGLYAISVVIRSTSSLDNGIQRHTTVVRYIGNDGKEHEGILNYSGALPVGRKVQIQYLPDKYDYVGFVSQEL